MLSSDRILELLNLLNEALEREGEIGEIGLVGGAVMCLVYNARKSTRDVDAIFVPSKLIRKLAAQIGEQNRLSPEWLNDAAKGYLTDNFERQSVLELSHLRVWAPDARYMLAMKCISARWDTHDQDDVIFLIRHLKLTKSKEVFSMIEKYYPKNKIQPKTQFLIEELFSKGGPFYIRKTPK